MIDAPGHSERLLARALIAELPPRARALLQLDGIDMVPAAEHVLYAALRQPGLTSSSSVAGAVLRGVARPIAAVRRLALPAVPGDGERRRTLVLVTQPVHARLFEPIGAELQAMGQAAPIRVAARTGEQTHVRLEHTTEVDLRAFLAIRSVPGLVRMATELAVALRRPPQGWRHLLDRADAERLTALLRAAAPRLGLDAARLRTLFASTRPAVVVCFSESGLLARLAPAAAGPLGVRVLDLPHADSADPWGSAGIGYDGVAVFGPRAVAVMKLAGVSPERIEQIGPLGYDDLHGLGDRAPARPHQVLFASQPVDVAKPYLTEAVKRAAMQAALAVAAVATPADLHILSHPTEDEVALRRLAESLTPPTDVSVRIAPPGELHARLAGAFALVTASSQSAFDAVAAGIPAIAVQPPRIPVPVTFVEEGIATRAESPDEAGRAAESLLEPSTRQAVVVRARAALEQRIGPLDGLAAERAARWLSAAGR